MATRSRKVRHLRGSRTHGWGQIGQHRHSGSRGGTGMAGLHKHKWSYTVKYAPDHFGHNVFRPPNRTITRRWLNVSDLPRVVGTAKDEVDLEALGYDKLLGQGEISRKYLLKIGRASSSALEKVKSAGGAVRTSDGSMKEKEEPKAKAPEKELAQLREAKKQVQKEPRLPKTTLKSSPTSGPAPHSIDKRK